MQLLLLSEVIVMRYNGYHGVIYDMIYLSILLLLMGVDHPI
ncbi:Uncharacterised protein [Fluoribacter dumoffii]|uniref:Uncharacterized protein n=1 Tax=Fluoribacter dumoffii TaxID=463 RepID=A0A377G9L8_9GAMM|nr:Uncharacterised protein [Fluoribacter dumoffii]